MARKFFGGEATNWMLPSTAGIDSLEDVERLTVRELSLDEQKVFYKEWGVKDKKYYPHTYIVDGPDNKHLYLTAPEPCCSCPPYEEFQFFDFNFVDVTDREVIHVQRPLRCTTGLCFPSGCVQELAVTSPPGCPVGTVMQVGLAWRRKFILRCINPDFAFSIVEKAAPFCSGKPTQFHINSENGKHQIGTITNDSDSASKSFTVSFPKDLHSRAKSLVLSAALLLEYMVLQKERRNGATR